MFTSEPSLAQRIERMVRDATIVDARTRLRPDRPAAPDLASLLDDRSLRAELRAVGLPDADLAPGLPPDERVRRAIPYLRRTRNTAAAWCFYRILRDLHDFGDPDLTESNYREALDRVATAGRDPDWGSRVLHDRCRVETIVTDSIGATSAPPGVKFALDAGPLVPAVPGDFDALTAFLGDRPATPGALTRALHDRLDAILVGNVRFTRLSPPMHAPFLPPDDASTAGALARAGRGQSIDGDDVAALARAVVWSLLEWHHEHRKALQIAVGTADPDAADPEAEGLSRLTETWSAALARASRRFGSARLDLLISSDAPAVLARRLPNVYASCRWPDDASPSALARDVALRLTTVPMTKFAGFLSEADSVEWAYARRRLAGKATASALAHLIESGFHEEEDVPPILDQILDRTPRDLYDLGRPSSARSSGPAS